MDINNIVALIGTLGFPIVMCLILLYVMLKNNEEHKKQLNNMTETVKSIEECHKKEIKVMTESLNANTTAIQHMTDLLIRRE